MKIDGRIDIDSFRRLNSLQVHRGPDESGIWQSGDGRIALGHNRLSIIDLKQGQQPMADQSGNLVLVYNGELYNFADLRNELMGKGRVFRTSSDTEVILASYAQWGAGCLSRFRGMFAFAIVDLAKKELFLARDHFGIKPLAYGFGPELFGFSSELGVLSQLSGIDARLDLDALDHYLRMQYIPAPLSAFKNIRKLEPASFMVVSFEGEVREKKQYWHPEFAPVSGRSESEWLEEFEGVIGGSVKAHTVSDVPVGAFLSGGIDSTLITGYLSRHNSGLSTFSIGFEEKDFNELAYSSSAAEKFGSRHHTRIVKPDFFSVLSELVPRFGEPFGDSSAIPTYFVSRLAREHVKVVLSGDGGDELFGGYNSYQAWQDRMAKKSRRSWLLNLVRSFLSMVQPLRYVPEKPTLQSWLEVVSYYNYIQRRRLWKEEFHSYLHKNYPATEEFKTKFKNNTLVHKAQQFDLENYLPYDILTKVDITSMMNSLEVRVPILDIEVARFALSIPEGINRQGSEWIGKRLLKKTLERSFAEEFVYRPKKGFAVPLDIWFGEKGPLYSEPYVRLINSESKLFRDFFHLDAVNGFIGSGEFSKLYLLLFLEEWLRNYENRRQLISL